MQQQQEEVEEEEARSFLRRFLEEFPSALEDGAPLPLSPLSRRVSRDELQGESLDLGLRLLAARGAPPAVGALLCQAAFAQLLQDDLSPFHCQQEVTEGEEPVVLLESESVQRLYLNKLIDVAKSWRHRLPPLPASPISLCSVHAIKNTRRKMEDRHVTLAEFNQLLGKQDGVPRAFYAVFDGHGGVDAATFGAAHLHVALSREETLQSDPAAAFRAAFEGTDEMFRGKAKRERLRSGSTAVAVLFQGQDLTVSWLGDSQALLVRRGLDVSLMDPHKPEREDEKQRIEDLGGCVTFMGCWRVNGTYAVSRAIGDFDQKPYVSSEADCATLRLQGDEDYLLLACDGFFDAVKPSEVPDLVLRALRRTPNPDGDGDAIAGPPEDAAGADVARQLVAHAKAAGSSDNITVILVFLRAPEQLLESHCATAPQDSQDALQQ
ncbi:unnamed protein product [Ophioblennius macclurei]